MNKWERITVYLLMGITLILILWVRQGKTSCEKLTIVNSRGEPAIQFLCTDSGAGRIYLNGSEGNRSIILSNAGIMIYGLDNKLRVDIGWREGPDGVGSIVLYGGQTDSARVGIYANTQGNGCIDIQNKEGITLARMDGRQSGGYIDFWSQNAMPLAVIGGFDVPTGETFAQVSAGGFAAYGFNGKPITAFGISDKGRGALTIWDENYNMIFQFPPKK